ncbi:hypothetical protein [Thalassotalea euphylliae]|nr:hypothetical protein [Thalassotalea euphylliae]
MNSVTFYKTNNPAMVFERSQTQSITADTVNTGHKAEQSTARDRVSISIQAYRQLESTADHDAAQQNNGDINRLKYGDLNTYENLSFMEKVQQAMMDKRMGLDREKVEEINEKMDIIIKDETIPPEEKEQLLKQLAKAKDAEYEKAAQLTEQQAESAAVSKAAEGQNVEQNIA